jgi:Zn-dependent peptidase ImmA (M78 family)
VKPKTPQLSAAAAAAEHTLADFGKLCIPVDVDEIAHSLGAAVLYTQLEANVSGLLACKNDSCTIAVNALHHPNRQRFTIAHELGHLVLHQSYPSTFVDDALVFFRSEGNTYAADPEELEANEFAGTLLMPQACLQEDLSKELIDAMDEAAVRDLASRYHVSSQALTIRLLNLGLLEGIRAPG